MFLWVCLLKSVPCVRHQDIPAGQGAACDLVLKWAFLIYTCNLHVAVPCKLHPRKDYTQGKEHSLHTWRSWVVLWHVCFKTAWVFLTCRQYGQWKGDWRCYRHLLPQCHMSSDKPMLLGWESYARVIYECSPVLACKPAVCDPVSSEPFPYTPAGGFALQVASKKLRRKKGRTSRFTLQQVDFHHTFCW